MGVNVVAVRKWFPGADGSEVGLERLRVKKTIADGSKRGLGVVIGKVQERVCAFVLSRMALPLRVMLRDREKTGRMLELKRTMSDSMAR